MIDNSNNTDKEAIIVIVGFLGAGKTTVLKRLTDSYTAEGWRPYILLNDYENAYLDVQQFKAQMTAKSIKGLSGSCICCNGIHILRDFVNKIPPRENGITLIEANGTTDACALAGFLGTGLNERFMPPVQLSVVNVKDWQQRETHNELEANQIQLSSVVLLTHLDGASKHRKLEVRYSLQRINPSAKLMTLEELNIGVLTRLAPSNNHVKKLDHTKAHWSSCSLDLPELPHQRSIELLCNHFPKTILRIKGCVRIRGEAHYTYFERTPDGTIAIRPFNGIPPMGPKLLTIGLGSAPSLLRLAIEKTKEE